jgi:hypothetical protein
MPDVTGSIRKVLLDGVSYDAFGSTNIKETGGQWLNEGIATSGRNLHKMTKRVDSREVELVAMGVEREHLVELSERTADFDMSYTTASGDVYNCTGWIEFANRETEESKATITMFPRTVWSSFVAS